MTPRVVLDTNIIVSAILSRNGNCAKILDMVFDNEIEYWYSRNIIFEYEDVLSRPQFNFDQRQVSIILKTLQEKGTLINPDVSTIPFIDEEDRIFYDTAMSGKSLLVTGNKKHFPKKSFIIAPADFLVI
ncbi:putative toxin-antitoxin system toxin component, PIN family [Treponema primitia]|uniref:putative toxin-antitoxin system toxin component, PIN family n=1 Tax=Treponema primitia TaxID=88058 RepID=UPI0002555841|nr:putative toxin-antitoxin system toxin component, PIN family [Treponema primitia]